MQTIALIGGIITLLAHLPLFKNVYKKTITLNLATWLVWAIGDFISLITSIYSGVKIPFLIISFTLASIIMVLLLLRNGTWKWGKAETFSVAFSTICIILWITSGPLVALIANVIGIYAATIPSLIDAYRKPERSQAIPWLLFALGAVTNIFAGGSWTLAYSLFPTVSFFFNGALGVLHSRKK